MTNTTNIHGLRDQVAATERQGYRLTRTYRIGTDIVQIHVYVDSYERQSCAVARILGSDRKWAELVSLPPKLWYAGRRSYAGVRTEAQVISECEPVADELLARADAILA